METRRTDVSCGCTQLWDLSGISVSSLKKILKAPYASWGSRHRPGGRDTPWIQLSEEEKERRWRGEYDNKIYAGETVFFSDNDGYGNGKKLRKIIKDHDLGRVVSIKTRNPNTLSTITTYLWVYNGNMPKTEK